MTQEKNEKPTTQAETVESEPVKAEQVSVQSEKPPEPPNIIFKTAKEPGKEPLIQFEKRTTEKKPE